MKRGEVWGGQASLFGNAAPAMDLFSIWRARGSFLLPLAEALSLSASRSLA